MSVNTNLYKKSGLVTMYLARDFFARQVGDRLPTINEYTEKFSVSRGIVQNAITKLEEKKCISIERRGVKGTLLVGIDYGKLYAFTNWETITGTMPIPLSLYLQGVTTAVCNEMDQAPFSFSFAYITGSVKRLEAIKNGVYDFAIVSQSTAQEYKEKYDFISICEILDGSLYSPEYEILFIDPAKREIEDGMRVGIDYTSYDQATLTRMLCKDKAVEFVEFPYIAFDDLLRENKIDCVVYRAVNEMILGKGEFGVVSLNDIEGFSREGMRTPVIITNKENYGMNSLLRRYIHPEHVREIQEAVITGKREVKFY